MEKEKKTRYTDAQKKAIQKYMREKVDDLRIRVPKGDKKKYQDHAKSCGESLNHFVIRALNITMQNDLTDKKKELE